MSRLSTQQLERLRDLLKEKSLWQVYRTSLRIRFSKLNIATGALAAALVTLLSVRLDSPSRAADVLLGLLALFLPLAISQLGFLLAGFSFFATVADKKMFCRMADKVHEQSGLSYLKYNFTVFMRVFVEYLVFSLLSIVLLLAVTKNTGVREALSTALGRWPSARLWGTGVALGAYVGGLMYLVMQLASFIYNIYHVVMTSIRWALQHDYEEQNALTLLTQPGNEVLTPGVAAASSPREPEG